MNIAHWLKMRTGSADHGRRTASLMTLSSRRLSIVIALVAVLFLVGGSYVVLAFGRYGEELERRVLSQMVSAAAASFPVDAVAQLTVTPSDIGTAAMGEVHRALQRFQQAVPQSRYTYLMALRDDQVIYIIDNGPFDAADFIAPGTIYDEATAELRSVFTTGTAVVEGPVPDHWGNWVSGIAPLFAEPGGPVIAILGIDIDADRWSATIDRYRLFGLAVVIALASIVGLFVAIIVIQGWLGAKLAAANRIVESTATVVYRMKVAPGMPITYVSNNIARFGLTPGDVIGSPNLWQDIMHPDDRLGAMADTEAICSGSKGSIAWERRLRDADGSYKWWRGRVSCLRDADGAPIALEGVLDEIDDRKRAEQQLLFTNTLLTTQMETSPDGILVVDETAHIVTFNRRFADMWAIPFVCVGGDDARPLSTVTAMMKDGEAFLARVRHLYEHPEEAGSDELETKDGRFIERHTAGMRTPDGRYLGRVWFFRDITARRAAEEQIRHSARHDGLTGLANRRVFAEAINRAIASARRGSRTFAVLYLDLDHFKDVNDTLGHPIGDELLCAVAGRLRSNVRETDTVARFGGDEFAVIAADIEEPSDAAILADALLRELARPYAIKGNDVRCGASIGIVVYGPDEPDAETLLAHADLALYRAKSEGRGRYRFFTDAMDSDVRARVTLSAELRLAIDSNVLFLLYQPQVDLKTRRITGLEALVRWRHPARGTLLPAQFLPVAETTGLGFALDRWVLREACRQARAWLDAGIAPPRVSVNLCAMQGKKPADLERDVAAALAEAGLPPDRIELELSDAMLREASPQFFATLLELHQRGTTFAADDFGTGISSLIHFRRLPIDRIKLAPSIVAQITTEPDIAAIVRTTIGLALEIGIMPVASGVETQEQLDLLTEWGCREAQGFHFAGPVSSVQVTPLLRAGTIDGDQAA
jgi:diguanylate cyclase (GGDEF)-like protein/PAS domain S-box-containing protein